ncbi:MAG TPA: hypothetical protein VK184_04490 [Nostocaceae cyanobacterium]|nr:hypothetical protein [Nostocaceae cyanobacterium]
MKIVIMIDKFPRLSEAFIVHQILILLDITDKPDSYAFLVDNIYKNLLTIENYDLLKYIRYQKVPRNYFWHFLKRIRLIINIFKKTHLMI